MSYPAHLIDALARVYAKVALDRLIKDELAKQAEQAKLQKDIQPADIPPIHYPEKAGTVDGPARVEPSDNRQQLLPEPRP